MEKKNEKKCRNSKDGTVGKKETMQGELWRQLCPFQQRMVANMLRHLKKESQKQLCFSLIEFIDEGEMPQFDEKDIMLKGAFYFLTGMGMATLPMWAIKTKCNSNF